MQWYKNLYVGENAKNKKNYIIRKIKKNKPQLGVYVLTLPENDNNIMDIYPSIILTQSHYINSDLVVIGIATSKEEAYEIMEKIVMDSYRLTGDFNIKEYINLKTH